jgi:LacI family transcriptional regulator
MRKSFSDLRHARYTLAPMPHTLRIALVFSYGLAYCRGILRGVRDYARTRQRWIFTPVDPESATPRLLRSLAPAGVIAHIFNDALARTLMKLDRPLVNVCGVLPDLPVARVGLDDRAIGVAAAEHLLDRGLRQFAFVGHLRHAYSIRREDGFRATLSDRGFTSHVYHDPGSPFDPRGRLWALDGRVRRWLVALPRPVGVFACNDLWGVQISELCRQAGLRVPEDVAVLGVDNDDLLCDLARPSLSSVTVPAAAVGHAAAALLDRLLQGRKTPKCPLLLPPTGVATRQSSDILAIHDPDVSAAVRVIRDRAHERLRTRDVLDVVPVSRRALERRFRKALGRGIGEEIRRCHVERARTLLATTDLPMSDVARLAGFGEGKQLSVVFRRETGSPPTAYRRSTRALVASAVK